MSLPKGVVFGFAGELIGLLGVCASRDSRSRARYIANPSRSDP